MNGTGSMGRSVGIAGVVLVICLGAAGGAGGWQADGPSQGPGEGVGRREVKIISQGVSMHGELYYPAAAEGSGGKLPTIVMCHGWGGIAENLRPDAQVFARAGYLVLAIDYRGWGKSDGRLVPVEGESLKREGGVVTGRMREVREVVDPIDQTTDLMNAIHWVHAEPLCDTARIGLWGSSYSGGHVVYAAARDARVKALVSQVPALDSGWVLQTPALRAETYRQGSGRARGERGYPAAGEKFGNMTGAPIYERMIGYAPVEDVHRAERCAMLFILAEKEELFDNRDHGIKAHERAKGPKRLVIVPGITHYGIYNEARGEAQRLAVEWFDEHLKGKSGG